jgi:hypothetical protein
MLAGADGLGGSIGCVVGGDDGDRLGADGVLLCEGALGVGSFGGVVGGLLT